MSSGARPASGTGTGCSAWEEGGRWGDRCALGPALLVLTLPDSEPLKGPEV